MRDEGTRPGPLIAALSGVLAGAVALGVAELAAALVRPQAAPLIAVGGAGIDRTPEWLKDFAIRTFGTHDKQVLLGGLLAGAIVLAALLGLLGRFRRVPAAAGLALFGLVGAIAALTRPDAGPADALPTVIGTVAGIAALLLLLRHGAEESDGTGRRAFLATAGGAVAVAAVGGIGGRLLAGRKSVGRLRADVRLPAPAKPAPPLPAGADLRVPGLTPFTTANSGFYRVDTALVLPQVDPAAWTLRVHGLVDRPFEITFDELLRRPLEEHDITLTCVSNEVGGPYAGEARWLGFPLAALLREAGVRAGADQVFSRSTDGFTVSTPIEAVLDGRAALLAVGMNGEPLPVAHGFPARLVVPGLYGYVSATKWVTDLKISRFADDRAYWTKRDWADHAPIKTMARIDLPRAFAELKPGRVPVAGVAWAQHCGISAVQVRIDGGAWRDAKLAPVPNTDTWRQWFLEWDAAPGSHRIEARAVDGTGALQVEKRADPFPDGASGWQSTVVTVR
ncbi:molybdopterin-dependent oxidoreductase [Actinomadura parmotrematis]|uniref:Molybdopterin-dependent oxidoreductase n=1 Tax=Actinomadura parmotrematis TaxID=2864039 RepID=A0ABS7FP44_9ACTN|nr:molybdopterin-dependent oxidoreductase [Actinomadura parmotrematis]MBW8481362.1 molybdopterin-dependent oxidoreductase [Actinomadura parmotrematis]